MGKLKRRIMLGALCFTLYTGGIVCAAEQTVPSEASTVYEDPVTKKALDAVRVRTAPTTGQDNAFALIKKDEEVSVYGLTDSIEGRVWAVIWLNGKWGFAADEFLSEMQTSPAEDHAEEGDADEGSEPEAATEPSDASEPAPVEDDNLVIPEIPDPVEEQVSEDSFLEPIGPEFLVGVIRQERIESYLHTGTTYVFSTYSDGSVEVETVAQ